MTKDSKTIETYYKRVAAVDIDNKTYFLTGYDDGQMPGYTDEIDGAGFFDNEDDAKAEAKDALKWLKNSKRHELIRVKVTYEYEI